MPNTRSAKGRLSRAGRASVVELPRTARVTPKLYSPPHRRGGSDDPRAALCLALTSFVLALPGAGRAAEPADLVLRTPWCTRWTRNGRAPSRGGSRQSNRRRGLDRRGAGLCGKPDTCPRPRGRTVVPASTTRTPPAGDRLRAPRVDLVGTRSYAEVVERVATAVKGRRPGEWIRGRGWHEGKWTRRWPGPCEGSRPMRRSPPCLPTTRSSSTGPMATPSSQREGHGLAGIARTTKPPRGRDHPRRVGRGDRGVRGQRGRARGCPGARAEEVRRALVLAMDECLAKGVTSLTDAGAGTTSSRCIAKRRGRKAAHAPLRDAAGLPTMRFARPAGDRPRQRHADVRSVKLYADGALGSRGAALLEPYSDDTGNPGLLVTPPEGMLEPPASPSPTAPVGTHAIGDRANRIVLDAYETAFRRARRRRTRASASSTRRSSTRRHPRFGRLGVLAAMQGIHCPSDRPWPEAPRDARVAEGAYVWRKLLDTGPAS